MITPPRHPTNYADRNLDCQEAIESRVIAIIDDARAAGWSIHDITLALTDLADNLMLQARANEATDCQISELLRKDQ